MLTVYRKYRPIFFNDIIGQDHIVSVIKQSIIDSRTAHAILLCGPRGTGKTSLARIIAKTLNCLNPINGESCNQCANCKSINKSRFMDLIEIDAASNRGIDEIRDLKNNVGFLPVEGKYKVYIIDEVHMLTEPAFNALLKTLEEPPIKVVFILATTEPQKLPLTIISRTQRFDFKLADEISLLRKIKYILNKEGISIEDKALDLIIKSGQGSFRDTETVLEKVISNFDKNSNKVIEEKEVEDILGLVGLDIINDFINNLLLGKTKDCFLIIDKVYSSGADFSFFLKRILDTIRILMINSIKGKADRALIKKYMIIIKELNNALVESKQSLINVLPIEVAIINIIELIGVNNKNHIEVEEKKPIINKSIGKKNVLKTEKNEVIKREIPLENKPISDDELNILNNKWNELLEAAKSYNHFLTAILSNVNVEKDKNGSLIFKVNSVFHKKRLDNRETKDILIKLIEKICGIKVDFSCIINSQTSVKKIKDSNSKLVEEILN